MKANHQTKPLVSKCFLFSLVLSLFLLFLVSVQYHRQPETLLAFTSTITTKPNDTNPDIRIRPGYANYDAYIQRQLNKTLNPKLRKIWTTRDWNRKINVFSNFFSELKEKGLLTNSTKALCVGARVGQEVEALRRIGVSDSVGIDLVPYPPLVIRGDFHKQPFGDQVFDFEFSNVFDHALYPDKFVGEIERTLKPGGVCVLHVALSTRSDKFSANDLYNIKGLTSLFRSSELVHTRKVDGFGLDTEVVFRKKKLKQSS
ncbi:uncharacterized protein LOC141667713 [Apium graveolens]|uniref:uncharacterized protein LOC141667713 n=1 Tax=Apium graveolens TaxID=4045 RepID=UPI003D7A3ED5